MVRLQNVLLAKDTTSISSRELVIGLFFKTQRDANFIVILESSCSLITWQWPLFFTHFNIRQHQRIYSFYLNSIWQVLF